MKGVETVEIEVVRLAHAHDLALPDYATAAAAGADLLAAIDQDIELAPLERKIVPTGISIALPVGFEAQVRPRSGLAAKNGVTLVNSPRPHPRVVQPPASTAATAAARHPRRGRHVHDHRRFADFHRCNARVLHAEHRAE
jgi:hypothetical protein